MPGTILALSPRTAAILAGGALSDVVNIGNRVPVGIQMPSAWDSADITFQGSVDGVTFQNLYDDGGNEIKITVAANRAIVLAASAFPSFPFLKLRSGTAAAAVNQSADRLLTVMCREG